MTTITDVCLTCDAIECGYRIVELSDGRFAFVWGNIRAHVGDTLPVMSPTCDKGWTAHDSYDAAENAWLECADALADSGATRAADELRAVAA
jgi:hypothetical protein